MKKKRKETKKKRFGDDHQCECHAVITSHHYDTRRVLSISAPGSQLPFLVFLSYAYVPQPEGMKGKRRGLGFRSEA